MSCSGDGDSSSDSSSGTTAQETPGDTSGNEGGASCAPGTLGCPCDSGSCGTVDREALVCVGGLCTMQSDEPCPLGTQGCACAMGERCGLNEAGAQLRCTGGVCEVPDCPVGTVGCLCLDGSACDDGLTCQPDGAVARCMEEQCPVGALGCACGMDRACGEGLACMGNVCAEPDCPVGTEGCACSQALTCLSGLVCNDASMCELAPACTPGSYGCTCGEGSLCDASDAVCADGTCQRVDCPSGEEGCACGAQGRCASNAQGEVLTCEEGLCRAPTCAPGDSGCVCREGILCNAPGMSCVEGYCMADSCEAGQEGCLCTGGACGPGLRCRDNTLCVDQTGFAGGACLGGQRCIRGNRCQNDVCVVCSLGSQGCGCRDNTTCNPGLMCDGDRVCVDPRGLAEQTPDTQVCTTPCTGSGLTLDNGRYMSCPASGLLSGCYGDSSCVEGQCLRPGAEPTRCETELDCPDFQTCLAHRCSSNCTTSEDCVTGATCHRQVCRTTCSVIDSTSVCGAEGYCHLVDGDRGVCMLNVPIDTGDPTTGEPIEVFTLSSDAVSLSNAQGTAPLVLTNTNPYPTTFTIAKRSDRRFDGDGAVEERLVQPGESCQGADCPMWWLLLDEPQVGSWAEPTQTFTLAGGAQTTLTIDNDGYTTAPRWEGVLEISSEHGVVRDVIITTTNDPTGQWSGEVYYFGNFKDMGIDAWTHDRDNPDRIDGMENAFMQLWARFRQGQTSFEQFQAGLTATRTESWRSPRLAELGCPGGSVCFPFDNFDGFLTYTTDPINIPVPTGVVEMPAMMNLKRAEPTLDAEACGGNALHCFTGRLESSNALQYAGEPRVTVTFESSPKSCTRQTAEAGCLVFLDQLGATIHVGARFATTSENTTCSGLEHMELAQEPWLVPGYTGRSTLDPDTGRRYTYTCRDTQAALPGANPMADGKVRERQLELIDGALVNGNILLIIFRERMDPILSTDPQDAIDGYGYMLLRHSDALLTGDQYEGHTPDMRTNPSQLRPVACTEAHFADLGLTRALFEAEPRLHADPMAQAILEGVVETEQGVGNLTELDHQSNEVVHYLCADTGLFDGGPLDDRASGDAERVPCPVGSRVTFFTLALDGSRVPLLDTCGGLSTRDCHQAWLAAQPCQTNGSCAEQLELWEVNATFGLRVDP
ncbi:MAG: hypothetical protein AAFS10_02515, partial [Myxococcota bacterium]